MMMMSMKSRSTSAVEKDDDDIEGGDSSSMIRHTSSSGGGGGGGGVGSKQGSFESESRKTDLVVATNNVLENYVDGGEDDNNDENDENSFSAPFSCERSEVLPSFFTKFIRRNRTFLRLALPSALIQFLRNFIQNIGLIIAGRALTSTQFAGFVFGFSLLNFSAVAIVMGIADLLTLYAPQIYGSIHNTNNPGQWKSQAPRLGKLLFGTITLCVIFSAFYFFAVLFFGRSLLVFLGRTEIIDSTMQFLMPSVLVVLGTGFASSTHKMVAAIHKVEIALYSYSLAAVFTIAISLLLLDVFPNSKIEVLSFCMGAGRLFAGIAMIGFTKFDSFASATLDWSSPQISLVPDRAVLQELLSNAVPSIVAACSDRWTFELISVFIAYSPSMHIDDISAFSVLAALWIALFPFGVACYVFNSTLTGNELGKGRGLRAQAATIKALKFTLGLAGFSAAVFVFFPRILLRVFTTHENILSKCTKVAPWFALGYFADNLQFVCQGSLKAAKHIRLIANVSLISQGLIWTCCFVAVVVLKVNSGLSAVGIIMALGNILNAAMLLYYIFYKLDWKESASQIVQQLQHEREKEEERQMGEIKKNQPADLKEVKNEEDENQKEEEKPKIIISKPVEEKREQQGGYDKEDEDLDLDDRVELVHS